MAKVGYPVQEPVATVKDIVANGCVASVLCREPLLLRRGTLKNISLGQVEFGIQASKSRLSDQIWMVCLTATVVQYSYPPIDRYTYWIINQMVVVYLLAGPCLLTQHLCISIIIRMCMWSHVVILCGG